MKALKQAQQRTGCYYYFLLISGILVLLALLLTAAGIFAVRRAVNQYTDAEPQPLPDVRLSEAEMEALQDRIYVFQQAIRQHRPASPLELSADDINALIATVPAAKSARGKFHVMLEDERATGKISIKLGDLGIPVFRNRYFNGVASFDLSVRDGVLRVLTRELRVKGKSLPPLYLNRIQNQNLASRINEDPRASMAMEALEKIEVKDSRVIITPKVPEQ